MKNKSTILLLSGGSDSVTLFGWLLDKGWSVIPVSIDYNQKHRIELESAKRIVKYYSKHFSSQVSELKIIKLDLSQIGGSALTDKTWEVPQDMKNQVKTVVPFRNLLMSTMACAYGSTLGIFDLFLTPVREDFAAYRDCRSGFYTDLMRVLGSGYTFPKKFTVHTPFIKLWKKQVYAMGLKGFGPEKIKAPFELSHSCYKGVRPGCTVCPACLERSVAFQKLGVPDPLFELYPK